MLNCNFTTFVYCPDFDTAPGYIDGCHPDHGGSGPRLRWRGWRQGRTYSGKQTGRCQLKDISHLFGGGESPEKMGEVRRGGGEE